MITTKRAYEELEREGLIYTRAGLGSFVSPVNREKQKAEVARIFAGRLQEALEEALALGLEPEEVKNIFRQVMEKVRKVR